MDGLDTIFSDRVKIKQLIAAPPGWRAWYMVFYEDKYSVENVAVACFALVQKTYGREKEDSIEPIVNTDGCASLNLASNLGAETNSYYFGVVGPNEDVPMYEWTKEGKEHIDRQISLEEIRREQVKATHDKSQLN